MSNMDKAFFTEKCKTIRCLIMEGIASIGSGHIGGCLSCVEALTVLRYKLMQGLDPKDPHKEGRDRLVISKGHAGPTMYAILADQGYYPMEWITTLNRLNTNLPSHTDMNHTPGIDMTAGSLGQGIACAVGLAYGSKLKKDGATIYCLVGDGESQEGEVWEAAHIAAAKGLSNLICMTDYKSSRSTEPLRKSADLRLCVRSGKRSTGTFTTSTAMTRTRSRQLCFRRKKTVLKTADPA